LNKDFPTYNNQNLSQTDPSIVIPTTMKMARENYFMAMVDLNYINTRPTHPWKAYISQN